jgi:hypothetical protein
MEYNNDFKYDLKVGQGAENEFAEILENSLVEVKYDLQASVTGNVFVEFESRGKASGIATTEAFWWTFKIAEGTFITIDVEDLKVKCRKVYVERGFVKGGDSNTSKGVLLPVRKLISK